MQALATRLVGFHTKFRSAIKRKRDLNADETKLLTTAARRWKNKLQNLFESSLLDAQILYQCNVGTGYAAGQGEYPEGVRLLEERYYSFDTHWDKYGPLCFAFSLGAMREKGAQFSRGNEEHYALIEYDAAAVNLLEKCRDDAVNLRLNPHDWMQLNGSMCEIELQWEGLLERVFDVSSRPLVPYKFLLVWRTNQASSHVFWVDTNLEPSEAMELALEYAKQNTEKARDLILGGRIMGSDEGRDDENDNVTFGQTHDRFPVRRSGGNLNWEEIMTTLGYEDVLPAWVRRAFKTYELFYNARLYVQQINHRLSTRTPMNDRDAVSNMIAAERFRIPSTSMDVSSPMEEILPWWSSWKLAEELKECQTLDYLSWDNFRSCCIAFQFTEEDRTSLVYELPLDIVPGSIDAVDCWERKRQSWPQRVQAYFGRLSLCDKR
jgi:hypothetical protein